MALNKIEGCNYFSYQEGLLGYLYYIESGIVKCNNANSTYLAIEHFSRRGFEIDWLNSNVGRRQLTVTLPEHLTQEESLSVLGKTKEELYAQETEDKRKVREEIISRNVDNSTGKVITEKYLRELMSTLNSVVNKDRTNISDWFNKFNIEAIRPNAPIIVVSTKPKKTIITEGRGLIWKLFEKGELRKLTKEEFANKMGRVNN